jgi:RNA recognition motif-containing protein
MSKKLFVGNLPFSMRGADLKSMFEQYGSVSEAVVISDRNTGRSKGFGFVTFENDAEADAATQALNGSDLQGRAMTVNEARPMEERAPRERSSDRGPPRRSSGGFNRRGGRF